MHGGDENNATIRSEVEGDPLLAAYDPSNPNYHVYGHDNLICDTGYAGCDPGAIQAQVRDGAVFPGQSRPLDVSKIDEVRLGFGLIRTGDYISHAASGDAYYNITKEGHTFFPGVVRRSVVVEGGRVYIRTIGVGIGDNRVLNFIAGHYFNAMDSYIRSGTGYSAVLNKPY
jgi:hypothetical protein